MLLDINSCFDIKTDFQNKKPPMLKIFKET